MSTAPIRLSGTDARRFMRRLLLLDEPVASVDAALAHHGYIQIDPLNVCGRMHDLILRNRVAGYREGDLMRHLHGDGGEAAAGQSPARKPAADRRAFEHHLPGAGVLVAFPLEAWPHLPATMRERTKRAGAWSGWLTGRERELAPRLLAEIAERGPMGSADFADARRAHRSVWGASTLVKSTLQKLFFHGRLLIAQRTSNQRRYDLPERALPAAVLARREASPAETARWLVLLKLRQRRLVALKRNELRLVADVVQAVAVDDCPLLHCLREDLSRLESASTEASVPLESHRGASVPRLLAPLDPLIYDRRVTAALWGFDYTWEVYTPPARRVRGYYALPVLAGLELVGHVEPKADRGEGRLRVVSRRVRGRLPTSPAVQGLARFLGLRPS